jgi:hypothetical protein
MNQKLQDKLQKLLALAKRGVGGEKVNAEKFLDQLLKKHNLTIDDIDQDNFKKRYFKYTNKENKTILNHVINKVLELREYDLYTIKGFREFMVKITDYENIQIIELYDFHSTQLAKEKKQILNDLCNAYIQKHQLFRSSNSVNDNQQRQEIDFEKLRRSRALEDVLENVTYQKKIE